MYDGTALDTSTADAPDTVIARAGTCGFTTEPWEVTAYRASITSTQAWLRILNVEHGDHLIDVAPVGDHPGSCPPAEVVIDGEPGDAAIVRGLNDYWAYSG